MYNLIGNILQFTETNYCTQNSRYLPFCDMVYFVTTWSLFAGLVTYNNTTTLSGASDQHQESTSVVRKKANNVFVPTGGRSVYLYSW